MRVHLDNICLHLKYLMTEIQFLEYTILGWIRPLILIKEL